jgi:hypothetical protein
MSRSTLNVIAAHWRGDASLAMAWWFNCVALTLLLMPLVKWLAWRAGLQPADTAGRFLAVAGLSALQVLLVPLWQMVGLWRATAKQVAQRGPSIARRATQVLAVLFTLLISMRALNWAAEQAISARVALAFGPYRYAVTLLPGGREIEVRGGLGYGVAERVGQLLAAAPQVRRIRLNSGGGALSEARKLRTIIRQRRLDTYTRTGCSSACVSAYVGGRFRYLQRGARIGVHMPRNWQPIGAGGINPAFAVELADLRAMGVPDWFLARWIATGQVMWQPPVNMLRMAGIVSFLRGREKADE